LAHCFLAVKQINALNWSEVNINLNWIQEINAHFALKMDSLSLLLCVLTGLCFSVIFTYKLDDTIERSATFYSLMLFSMAGLMGVFLASDALLFYIFWELALIPIYFLCSGWGGPNRIAITFKFFVYTFLGSVLMLLGILYMYYITPAGHSFSWQAFVDVQNIDAQEKWLFWLFFAAFAVKVPLFPLHTWQSSTYSSSLGSVTAVLSALMAKMGLFAVVRWLLPLFPFASKLYAPYILILIVVGLLYASFMAWVQDKPQKVLAYSSMGHVALMAAGAFCLTADGLQACALQMFNHGVIMIGLWLLMENMTAQLGQELSLKNLGGLAKQAPVFTLIFGICGFANIALPLTNGFTGEFLLFNALFKTQPILAIIAGISVIVSATYFLRLMQKMLLGAFNQQLSHFTDLKPIQTFALSIIVVAILFFGIYPKPLIDVCNNIVPQAINALIIK
jgi:NADH-quinone oxidoreductase subunit M